MSLQRYKSISTKILAAVVLTLFVFHAVRTLKTANKEYYDGDDDEVASHAKPYSEPSRLGRKELCLNFFKVRLFDFENSVQLIPMFWLKLGPTYPFPIPNWVSVAFVFRGNDSSSIIKLLYILAFGMAGMRVRVRHLE